MEVNNTAHAMMALCDPHDIRILQRGTTLTTIGLNGKRQYWKARLSPSTSRILFKEYGKKFHHRDYVEVMNIAEVRFGCRTNELHSALKALNPANERAIKLFEKSCFSIHVGEDGGKIYNIWANSSNDARRWVKVVTLLVRKSQDSVRQNVCDPSYWLRRAFREADIREKGYLGFDQCTELLKSISKVTLDKDRIPAFFYAAQANRQNPKHYYGLDEDEFIRFYQLTSHRPELDSMFFDLIGKHSQDTVITLSAEKLLKFLTEVQGVANLDLNEVQAIIKKYDQTSVEVPLAMSLNGFHSMMVSELFDIRKKEHRKINQPMDRPLSHYWIKSSHDAFLLPNQMEDKNSMEAFRRAIARNCGCVELDLWDGPNGEAFTYHDGVKIIARDVISEAVLHYAFLKDDYPIILSIKDHLSDSQRQRFIFDFKKIMANHVYVINASDLTSLPSPNQLKRKVIIKASNEKWGELSNICQDVRFPPNALKKGAKVAPVVHVCSLPENELKRLLKPSLFERIICDKQSAKLRRQNMRELTTRQQIQVCPGVQRQLSDNYSPIDAMNAGCQLATTNVKTKVSDMAIYEGRFRANGDCGYALKPDFLLDPSAPRVGPKRIKIKIISGQNLPSGSQKSIPVSSPFVSVRVGGETCDKNKKTTKKVDDNGHSPVWNTEMTFDVKDPELGVILFQAKQNYGLFGWRTSTLGSFALPVLSLASGYRHIPLQDKNMARIPLATLFVHVTVEDI